jgi:hypothetical protein
MKIRKKARIVQVTINIGQETEKNKGDTHWMPPLLEEKEKENDNKTRKFLVKKDIDCAAWVRCKKESLFYLINRGKEKVGMCEKYRTFHVVKSTTPAFPY